MKYKLTSLVILLTALVLASGCVSPQGGIKGGEAYSRLSIVNLEPINSAVSIRPTKVLPHLQGKIDQEKLDKITDMLREVIKEDGKFQPVEVGGDQYEYAVTGTVVDLRDLFNNQVYLQVDIQDKSSDKSIYSYVFPGIFLTQNSSIDRIAELLRSKINEIRAVVSTHAKEKSSMVAKAIDIRLSDASGRKTKYGSEQGSDDKHKPETVSRESNVALPAGQFNYGRYYALVIGNNNYQYLPGLKTAHQDARDIATLLQKHYGFDVKLLLDAKRADIITTLFSYRERLGAQDNLLIYYAGHGWLDKEGDEGYWLPVDATKNDELNWVSNSSVTTSLKAMGAKHVLIIADSCYSGKLARGLHIAQKTPDYYSRISQKRARLVLASGGLEPVIDSGGKENHSIFASALLAVLSENQGIIDGNELFNKIRRPIMLGADQTPEYADIRKAGHDGGDFIFVKRKQ
ncbi:MAG: caspase domain-containing protein [Smithellaceae bacterium]